MAKWTIASYNRFINASVKVNGLSRWEAAGQYRAMKERLGRSVFRTDIKLHPRLNRETKKSALETRGEPVKPAKPGKAPSGDPGGVGAAPPPAQLPPLQKEELDPDDSGMDFEIAGGDDYFG